MEKKFQTIRHKKNGRRICYDRKNAERKMEGEEISSDGAGIHATISTTPAGRGTAMNLFEAREELTRHGITPSSYPAGDAGGYGRTAILDIFGENEHVKKVFWAVFSAIAGLVLDRSWTRPQRRS